MTHRSIPSVILVGNPNVGKSSLFSRLTGTKVITSNFPGTTLNVVRGTVERPEGSFELIDLPGLYSLTENTKTAQHGALKILHHADIIVNVLDATNLKRNLYLTMQLRQLGIPLIVVLNMWDEAEYHGIDLDIDHLSRDLGVPVIPTTGISGHGVGEVVGHCLGTSWADKKPLNTDLSLPDWQEISRISHAVTTTLPRRKRPLEHLATLTLHPVWGTLIALAVLGITFTATFFLSSYLELLVGSLFSSLLNRPLLGLHSLLEGFPFLQTFLIGNVPGATIDFESALGLLTSGIYIPLAQVAPPVTSFYIIMGMLEDCGYLPRLATLSDTLMHRYALHGFALVPMILGAGCNVTGIVGTRVLESRRQRIITAALLSITVPCSSQTGFIIAMTDRMGMWYTLLIFVTLALTWHILGTILGQQEQHNYQEMIIEIPPLRLPRLQPSWRKLSYRVTHFLSDAIPITIAGIGVLLFLNYFSVLEYLGSTVFSFLHTLWGLPARVIPALFMGLFRKEIALSFLRSIPELSASQSFISTLLLTLWFPCVSVYAILYKEFGIRSLIRMVGLMFAVSTTLATFMHMALSTFG